MVSQEELKNMSPEQILELQKQQCIFCKIIAGQVPCKKIYDDKEFIAILDIRPANAGHVLVLPKEHFQMMPQIPPEIINKLALVTKGLSNAMLKGLGASGTTIFVANGIPAGQRAPHFMLHVIPRFDEDKVNIELPERAIKDEDILMLQERLIPFVNKAFDSNIQIGAKTKEDEEQAEAKDAKASKEDESDELLAALSGKEKEEPKKNSEDKKNKELDNSNSIENNKPKGGAGADLDAIANLLG